MQTSKKASVISLMVIILLTITVSVSSAQSRSRRLNIASGELSLESQFNNNNTVKENSSATTQGLIATDLEKVSIIVTVDSSVNTRSLETISQGDIVYQYSHVFNGVSMIVAGDKVDAIAAIPGVTGIYLDELRQLDTEVSPDFIGAGTIWDALGGQDDAGEGIIVGVLDSGVWPEHPSFSDPDPDGEAYAAPPVVPGSNGFGSGGPRSTCEFGNTAFNPDDAPFTCNNKLIGAYSFIDTYKAVVGLLPEEFDSARDADGHGTHTATTAAGNGNVAADIYGVPRGLVSGVAPRAHVIGYKVCGDAGCFQSDSVAAVEQAILDGVDSINFSISGGNDPYVDVVEQAFSVAYREGVFVAASAGNSGPTPDTVAHRGPWTTTVAASTSDRHFISTVTLVADNSDTLTLDGASVTDGISTATDVVLAADFGDGLCLTPFAPGTFSGQIVVCERGVIARVEKSFNVAAGGASGLLLYNPVLQGLSTDNHFIPSVHLENDSGIALLDFLNTHTGVTATFTAGVATAVPGDVMAAFSSRGGPGQTLGVSKPDITAPGVQILAGHTPLPATVAGGLPGQLFQSIQGTSMSSPHIAGAAALLKDLHPDWTPGQIKSAIMMAANGEHVKEDGVTPADPFDYGSGRVDLNTAGGVGLSISATYTDFIDLENELWQANYPSLYIPTMPGRTYVERTVHNEKAHPTLWRLFVESPDDVTIIVPPILLVRTDKTFPIIIDARNVPLGEVRHATILFKRRGETLRFPISFVRNQPSVTLDQTCDPTTLAIHDTTDCTITLTNTDFDDADVNLYNILPRQLRLVDGSVVGGEQNLRRWVTFEGTLAGAQPPLVNVAVDPLASPFGYVSLAPFSPIDVGATDESIANFNVPPFIYAGETYSQIGIVSNGYVVVGGGTNADVDFVNSDLPAASIPNNVLAPFWTDLNPGASGRVLIQLLGDGTNSWIVVEWESVSNFGDGETNTAQIWIGYTGGVEDISFVYGADVSDGDGSLLTVGAENEFGNSGGTTYFNGVGTPPAPSFPIGNHEVDIFSVPGAPGETHTITYTAEGRRIGTWNNCAQMSSPLFFGTNIACISGEVTP